MNTIITVSELNKQTKQWLEQGFPKIQVKGEISNLARPASRHLYFTLKDEASQIKCAYFRHQQNDWSQGLENGQSVILIGKVTLYEPRGDYQLIVSDIVPDGEGILLQQIEQLKQKLNSEGLFDPGHKRPIPKRPMHIGIITSDSGAAIHDILTTLRSRYPIAKVKLFCSEVQGTLATSTLIRALHHAILDKQIEVLIIARGGGSLEDLMPFNNERLARKIYHCPIPIVSGVGHETDITICDYVADHRAATPTAAAQVCSPDIEQLHHDIINQIERMSYQVNQSITSYRQKFAWLTKQLLTPTSLMFSPRWQTLDYLQLRLTQAQQRMMVEKQNLINIRLHQINKRHPRQVLQSYRHQFSFILHRLQQTIATNLKLNSQILENAMTKLHALSPLATLNRGYSIATYQGNVIHDPLQVKIGDRIEVRIKKGALSCQVTDTEIIDD